MDRYGQIGPEKGNWNQDCRRVADVLADGRTPFVALAHRGTRQEVMLVLASRAWCVESEPEGIDANDSPPWALLSVVGRGACWVQLGVGFMRAEYLAEHLSAEGHNPIDAESLAALLDGVSAALGQGQASCPA